MCGLRDLVKRQAMTNPEDQVGASGADAERLAASIRVLLHALTIRAQDTSGDGRIAFSGTELATLGYIREHPGSMSREVIAFLGLTPTTVQSLLDRLVRKGVVMRQPHKDDGRAVALFLTGEGAARVAAIRAQDVENCAAMLSVLPAKRRSSFVSDLEAIARRLSE
jgi:DNA-binding MarR family transcriptional regulator